MAASLYDDLDVLDGTPLSSTETSTTSSAPLVGLRVAANWTTSEAESLDVYGTNSKNSTSMQLMQSHMAVKRAQGRRDNTNVRPSIAPVVDLKQRNTSEGAFRFNHQTGRLERGGSRSTGPVGSSPAMLSGGLLFGEPTLPLGVTDEYNPLIPNDYEELARLKRERRRAEEAAIAARRHDDQSGMCRRPDFSDYEDDEDEEYGELTAASGGRRQPPAAGKGAAIAPPSALLEGVTVEPGTSSETVMDTEDNDNVGATTKFGINAVAAKMMARMGYREGQGLGRESQGMASALVVEKTSRRGGKIIHERDQQKQQQQNQSAPLPDATIEETITNLPLPENRSCVILLRNMCGPGEVDDDLQPETAEECAKYGKVASCMIFELADTPDDEAVRIFVEFETEDGATNAVLDLNGRFFAGRVVKAGFYDAEKFRNLELADPPISA